jgi:hypothetical protein
LWDLVGSRRPLPAWTLLSYLALAVVPLANHDPAVRGAFRLAVVATFTIVIVAGPDLWCWQPGTTVGGIVQCADTA